MTPFPPQDGRICRRYIGNGGEYRGQSDASIMHLGHTKFMPIQPQTIGLEISEELTALLDKGQLHPRESAVITGFLDRIDKLNEGQFYLAQSLRASTFQMCGDVAAALECLATVPGGDPTNPDVERFCVLANLGFITEALPVYQRIGSPVTGSFSKYAIGGISAGAIRTIAKFISQARSMNLTNLDKIPVATFEAADALLARMGVNDEDIARALSVAGAIFRESGLVYIGDVGLEVYDEPGELEMVKLCYRLAITPSQAVSLDLEFLDRMEREGVALPRGVLVAFEGVFAEEDIYEAMPA
jgi:hypothetical protein